MVSRGTLKLNRSSIRPLYRLWTLAAVAVCAASCTQSREDAAPPGESFPVFTENGAWCWFSDPRAVYFEGTHKRTYSGWVDSTGNIVVGSYDHRTKEVETAVVHEMLEKDDHDNPSLFIDNQGRLSVYYSMHAHTQPIYLLRSVQPEDIHHWEPRKELHLNDSITYAGLSNTYTYANVCELSEERGKLFLFWRGADFKPNVSTSDDGGTNWSTGKILILPDRTYRDRRPYLKASGNSIDAIHVAFTDGHPRGEPTNSIYYARYQAGALYKADGTPIGAWGEIPFKPTDADLVYNAAPTMEKAWIWDVASTTEGQPVLVYAGFPTDSTHVYYYAIWSDNKWQNFKLTDAGPWFPQTPPGTVEREPNYSGGLVLDHDDPSIVYLSRKKEGRFEIEQWTTNDAGKSWAVKEITRKSANDNVRPFVIRNHPADGPSVLWMNVTRYNHYTDYRSSIHMDK